MLCLIPPNPPACSPLSTKGGENHFGGKKSAAQMQLQKWKAENYTV